MQTNESLHCSCEDAFREYFSTFDGIPNDYKEVEDLHDALYHDDYFVGYDSFILSHNIIKKLHADYHRGGAKVQILQITFESDLIDVKFHVENKKDGEDFLIHMLYTIENDKIAKSREVLGSSFPTQTTSKVSFRSPLCSICEHNPRSHSLEGSSEEDDTVKPDLDSSRNYSTSLNYELSCI